MKARPLPPSGFYSINKGNQIQLVFAPDYDPAWFEALKKKYTWDNFDLYNNKLWEYRNFLLTPVNTLAEGKTKSHRELFNKLTRGQKVFDVFLAFSSQTDNGGVYQFLFNHTEYCFAALETMDELNLKTLAQDYEKCLEEFLETFDRFVKRIKKFNNEKLSWEERCEAFTGGYGDVVSGRVIEDYYFDADYKKQLYQTVVQYIERHLEQFVKNYSA